MHPAAKAGSITKPWRLVDSRAGGRAGDCLNASGCPQDGVAADFVDGGEAGFDAGALFMEFLVRWTSISVMCLTMPTLSDPLRSPSRHWSTRKIASRAQCRPFSVLSLLVAGILLSAASCG